MKVLMLVTKDSTKDSRVKQERNVLEDSGYEISIYDLKTRKHQPKIIMFFVLIVWNIRAYQNNKHGCYDVVHCHDFDTIIAGVMLKKKTGCKLVYDSHEMYAFMTNIWMVIPFEKILLENVDICICVNESVKEYLYQLGVKKVVEVLNTKPLLSDKYIEPVDNGWFTISYFGNLSEKRMFPDIVDIVGKIDGVRLIVGGFGPLYDEVETRSRQYDNVEFLGWVSDDEVIKRTIESNLVVCMVNPYNKNCLLSSPVKLFESMVAGRPLVTTKNTLPAKMIAKYGCGFVVDYTSSKLKEFLEYIKCRKEECKSVGITALYHASNRFNWKVDMSNLLGVYRCLK